MNARDHKNFAKKKSNRQHSMEMGRFGGGNVFNFSPYRAVTLMRVSNQELTA
jgi:hypothetical protein